MFPFFIRLHNCNNNSVVIVNASGISCIDTNETEYDRVVSEIIMDQSSNLETFYVNESPEKIYEMIEKKISLNMKP